MNTKLFIFCGVVAQTLTAKASAANDFCAVHIVVVNNQEMPVETAVQLIDPSGTVVKSTRSVRGIAEFCDFGFGFHAIRVGDECSSMRITKVRVLYGETKQYSAVYNCPRKPGDPYQKTGTYNDELGLRTIATPDGGLVLACLVYFRISSETGPLGSAEIMRSSVAGDAPIKADRYGRAAFKMASQSKERVAVSAPGYETESIEVSCR